MQRLRQPRLWRQPPGRSGHGGNLRRFRRETPVIGVAKTPALTLGSRNSGRPGGAGSKTGQARCAVEMTEFRVAGQVIGHTGQATGRVVISY